MHASRSSFFKVLFLIDVLILFCVYVLSKMTSMVLLRGILVNSETTSNETNLKPSSNECCGMFLIRSTASKLSFKVAPYSYYVIAYFLCIEAHYFLVL